MSEATWEQPPRNAEQASIMPQLLPSLAEAIVTDFVTDCLGQIPTLDLVNIYQGELNASDKAALVQLIDNGKVDLYVHWQ